MINSIYYIYLFILAFAPLAFGTVELWSYTIVEFLVGILFISYLLNISLKKQRFYQVPALKPLLLFLSLILFQLLPLPQFLIQIISPEVFEIYTDTYGVFHEQAWLSITLNKKATLDEFNRYAAYALFYILTVQLLRDKKYLKQTIRFIVFLAVAIAFLGIFQYFLSNGKIYWIRSVSDYINPFGPYISRNHFAGYMAMVFPLSAGLFFYYQPEIVYTSIKERFIGIFSGQRGSRYIIAGFFAAVIATAICTSLSRGGIISFTFASIIFSLLLVFKRRKKRGALLFFGIIAILFSLVFINMTQWDPVIERIKKLSDENSVINTAGRVDHWKVSIRIIRDFPVTGSGMGTYALMHPVYRERKITVQHAHNDYLELICETGFLGFFLFLWFVVSVTGYSFRMFRKRRDKYSISLFAGAFSGIISLLIFSLSDSNLHNGANGLYFFFLCGLSVVISKTRFRENRKQEITKEWENRSFIPVFVTLLIYLIISVSFNTKGLIGQFYYSFIKNTEFKTDMPREQMVNISIIAGNALDFDSLNSDYAMFKANIDYLLKKNEDGFVNYQKAVELNPVNSEYLQRLGSAYIFSDEKVKGEHLLKAGVKYDPANPDRYILLSSFLLHLGKRENALEMIRKAMEIDFRIFDKCIGLLVISGLKDEEILASIPPKWKPYIMYADFVSKTGNEELADRIFQEALVNISKDSIYSGSDFYRVYSYYIKKKEYNKALNVMRKAVELIPESDRIRVTTAWLYEKTGISYRAAEEYQNALLINPKNKRAIDGLKRLRD